jgi:hypothetical protein
MARLKDIWTKNGVSGPFFTADGPTPYMLEAGHVEGAAIGLDSGSDEKHWELARSIAPGVPIFSSETYPGWLTHWGEKWARPAVPGLLKEVTFLLGAKKSFNFYVVHGGTNFGFTAGANSGGKGYEPDVTSYDYATVFVGGKYVGALDRRLGEKTIDLPRTDDPMPVVDILVEGMGHINFAQEMIDRKGITDRVTLSGMTLMNWQVFLLPLADARVTSLRSGAVDASRPGMFFRGTFRLDEPADTFIDMTGYRKGVVWVNGHNLGRYWDIGPQRRLYCPAPWLKAGENEVIVFDLHKTEASPLRGAATRDE